MEYNWEKHNKNRDKLVVDLEKRSYDGDRSAKDYQMEEVRPNNYGQIERDEDGLLPEEKPQEDNDGLPEKRFY